MSPRIEVQHAGLDAMVGQLNQATTAVQQQLDTLTEQCGALRGQWSGEAELAFDRAHRRWTAQMEQIRAMLAARTAAADNAHTIMRDTESAVMALWR